MRFDAPLTPTLPMNLTLVGTSRCDVPARETAGGIVAPLHAARTAQRAVLTRFRGSMREGFRRNQSSTRFKGMDLLSAQLQRAVIAGEQKQNPFAQANLTRHSVRD